ncbi:MAG: hypothetical protein SFU83_24430 [Meiothermus sp.]|nr:hypothetical protein [Meiothermus sp.]
MRFLLTIRLLLLVLLAYIPPLPPPQAAPPAPDHNPQATSTLEWVQEDEASYPFTWQVFLFDTSRPSETCAVLLEDLKQQQAFLSAYQNPHLLEYARKNEVDWSGYFEAIRNLSVKIYQVGELGALDALSTVDQIPTYFAQTNSASSNPYPVVVMETHANGTIWGLDAKGNHLQLVNRGGLISESAEEQVLEAHKAQFGQDAGKVIFYANLYHEMKHLAQLRQNPALVETMSLDQYQRNEVEAYQVSLNIVLEALSTHGCKSPEPHNDGR